MGSSNGTFINGIRVAGVSTLNSNDILKVGNAVVPWMNYINMGGFTKPQEEKQQPQSSSKDSSNGDMKLKNSTGALVTGIVGLVLVWMPILSLAGIVLNIIAVVLGSGAISNYKENKNLYTDGSYRNARAGMVCGIIGLSLMVLGILFILIAGVSYYGF